MNYLIKGEIVTFSSRQEALEVLSEYMEIITDLYELLHN